MWPIVPTFTCGLLRSNFSLAMFAGPRRYLPPNSFKFSSGLPSEAREIPRAKDGADVQDRTGDLVLTKDALCQLSYIGPPSLTLASLAASAGRLRLYQLLPSIIWPKSKPVSEQSLPTEARACDPKCE